MKEAKEHAEVGRGLPLPGATLSQLPNLPINGWAKMTSGSLLK